MELCSGDERGAGDSGGEGAICARGGDCEGAGWACCVNKEMNFGLLNYFEEAIVPSLISWK